MGKKVYSSIWYSVFVFLFDEITILNDLVSMSDRIFVDEVLDLPTTELGGIYIQCVGLMLAK